MKSIFRCFDRILECLTKAAAYVAGLCILLTAFIIVYEIITRGVFNSPTEWVLEVSVYLILVAGFLGMAAAYRHDGHVKVDFLISHLNPKQRCVLDIFTSILGVSFFLVFMTESMDVVLTSIEFSRTSPTVLRVPLWIPQFSLVCGGFLILLEMIRKIIMDIYLLKYGVNLAERQGK